MVKVTYKHWQKDVELVVTGTIVHNNDSSDRIVVQKEDGKFEDILRHTVLSIEDIGV
jgi:hypothetical protein